MKKFKNGFLLILFSWFAGAVIAQTSTERKLSWDYPVKPGTERWERHTTTQERVADVQVPREVLTALSTEDLTYVCLENPLMGSLFVYSPYDRGLDTLFVRYNCFRELLHRKDVIKGLLNWYNDAMQNLSFLNGNASDVQKGKIVRKIAVTTLLFNRCQMPDISKTETLKEILKQLCYGYEKMLTYPDFFGSASFEANYFTRAKIIIHLDEKFLEKIPSKEKNAVFVTGKYDEQTKLIIDDLSLQLIK